MQDESFDPRARLAARLAEAVRGPSLAQVVERLEAVAGDGGEEATVATASRVCGAGC